MRRVQITLGSPNPLLAELVPPGLREIMDAQQMGDAYCVVFENDDGGDALVAYMTCLCAVASATEIWLIGGTLNELEAALRKCVSKPPGLPPVSDEGNT